MNAQPLFSVLIANYNNGKYIEEAIQSVFNQTYTNWEIIIVDDASTDNSLSVLSKYKSDSRFLIFEGKENEGCGNSKNKCAELAKGHIAGFLDPDDLLENTALQKMIEAHFQHPDASLVYSSLFLCDEYAKNCTKSTYVRPIPKDSSFLKMKSGMVSQFATFKLDLYRLTSGISKNYKRAVDQDLYLKLEEVGKLLFIDEHLYYYRINRGGISSYDNYDKAFSWNILARIEACKRRNVSIEDILPIHLQSEKSIRMFYENSKDYKLGLFLLRPIRFVMGMFKR
jgi:glycosyltransferase involved in cell wall biosynthesis